MLNPADKLNLDWSGVEQALAEGTISSYKIAVLETEKLLEQILNRKKFPGKNIEKKLSLARKFLADSGKLDLARRMREKIIIEPNFDLSLEDTKQIIASYYQALTDLDNFQKSYLSFWQNLLFSINQRLRLMSKPLKKASLYIVSALFLTLILADTQTGQAITKLFIDLTHFLIYKVFVWLLLITIAGLAGFGVYHWRKGK